MVLFTWRTYESFNTPKEAWLKIGTLLLGTAVVWGWLRRRTVQLPWGPIIWGAVALWGWGWLSLVVSPHPLLTLRSQAYSFHLLLVMLLLPLLLKGWDHAVRLWFGVAVVGGVVALIAVAQYLGFDYEQGLRIVPIAQPLAKAEIYSTVGNPNYLAAVLAFLLPVTVALAVGSREKNSFPSPGPCIFLWGCAGLSALAILLTGSKGGLLAAIGGLVALWFLWGRWRGWSLKKMALCGTGWGGAGLLLMFLLGWLFPVLLPGHQSPLAFEWGKLSRLTWQDPSVKGRLLIWQTALEMIATHPMTGVGTGTFGAQYQHYRARIFDRLPDPAATYPASEPSYNEAGQAHNEYLQLAAESGLVGLALFLGLIWLCYATGFRLLREWSAPGAWSLAPAFESARAVHSLKSREDRSSPLDNPHRRTLFPGPLTLNPGPLLCGILAGMAAILIHAAVDFPLHQPVSALLFWFGIGTVLALSAQHSTLAPFTHRLIQWRPQWPFPHRFRQGLQWVIGAMVVLGAGWLMVQAVRPVVAEAYHRDAWVLMSQERWAQALSVIEQGLKWDHAHPELILWQGVASYQLGDISRSRAAYERYHSLYSDFQTLYNLGLIAVRERNFSTAEGYFREALRYKPTLREAAEALALVVEQRGRLEGSLRAQ